MPFERLIRNQITVMIEEQATRVDPIYFHT